MDSHLSMRGRLIAVAATELTNHTLELCSRNEW